MASLATKAQSPATTGKKRAINFTRTLAAPLGHKLLGQEVTAEVYARNGFRFVGTPAWAPSPMLEKQTQRLRAMEKLRIPTSQHSIRIGYESAVPAEDAMECVRRLRDPRHRMMCELFWPHLPEPLFEKLRVARQLGDKHVVESLKQAAQAGSQDAVLAAHALAVIYHNAAISQELHYSTGGGTAPDKYWQRAASYWSQVIASEVFWDYIRDRLKSFDDPRLRPDETAKIREDLATVVLSFNVLFARTYAELGTVADCRRHLLLVKASGFSEQAKNQMLIAAVRVLAAARLEPLIARAERGKDLGENGILGRAKFREYYEPIIEEACRVRDELGQQLMLSDNLLAEAQFDRLAQALLLAIDKRLDYRGEDRERALIYGMLLMKRLRRLPLSRGTGNMIDQSFRGSISPLYRDMDVPATYDPSVCFFLQDEEADPDASLLLSMYHIISCQGGNVRWETRRVLVPRSQASAKVHRGKAKAADVVKVRREKMSAEMQQLVKKIETERDARTQPLKQQIEEIQRQTKRQVEAKLAEHRRQHAAEESVDAELVRVSDAELAKQTQPIQEKLEQCIDQAKAAMEPALGPAREHHQRAQATCRGWRAAALSELPACCVLAGGLGLATHLYPAVAASIIPAADLQLAVALGAGSAVGLLLGRAVRGFRMLRAGRPLARLEAQLQRQIADLQRDADLAIRELTQAEEKKTGQARKRLQKLADERQKIEESGQKDAAKKCSPLQAQVTSIQNQAAGQLEKLEKKIAAATQIRPERDQYQFPAYSGLKKKGFQDGTKPSDSEISQLAQQELQSFLNSLTDEERASLAFISQAMGQDKLVEIISRLMTMPRAERRALLSQLAPLGMMGRRW